MYFLPRFKYCDVENNILPLHIKKRYQIGYKISNN